MKRAASANLALGPDASSLCFHQRLGDIEAQAKTSHAADILPSLESIEDMRELIRRDPDTRVDNRHEYFSPGPFGFHFHRGLIG